MMSAMFWLVITILSIGWTVSEDLSEDDICYGLHVNKLYCTCKPTDVDVRGIDCFVLSDFPASDSIWRAFHPLTKLERISLFSQQESKLTYVPVDALRHSVNVIETLEIRHGAIRNIPSFTFLNSTSLSVIDLSNNEIATLNRYSFFSLPALKELHLSENVLVTVKRETFVSLPRLSLLLLDRNRIKAIEESTFDQLGGLQELTLMKNDLRHLTAGMFNGLGSLKRLELGMNKIKRLENGVFANLIQVQELNLRENQLTTIEPDAFRGLANLITLYLNRNQLVRINDGTFRRLHLLRYLDLRFNSLTTLSESSLSSLRLRHTNTSQVYLTENQFECDCRIKWMLEMTKLKSFDELNQWKLIECKPPPESEMEQNNKDKKGTTSIGKGDNVRPEDHVANDRPSSNSGLIALHEAFPYIESKKNCQLQETRLKMKSSTPSSFADTRVYSTNSHSVLTKSDVTYCLPLLILAIFFVFK